MADYFKHLRQLLALSGESFEDELSRLVSFYHSLKRSFFFHYHVITLIIAHNVKVAIFSLYWLIKILFQGFSTCHLTLLEVLAAIQHTELRLGWEFTKEDFKEGSVGGFMIPDDFNPKITVSCLPPHLPSCKGTVIIGFRSTWPFVTEKKCKLALWTWNMCSPFNVKYLL